MNPFPTLKKPFVTAQWLAQWRLLCAVSVCTMTLGLTGCLIWPFSGDGRKDQARPSVLAETGQYHFDWKLSGNRAVAPLQVFDDGHNTWLQFPAGQAIPAIFARTALGDQLLVPSAGQGGLYRLDGVWPQLVLRGGNLQSVALRLQNHAEPARATPMPAPIIPAQTQTPPAMPASASPVVEAITPPIPAPLPAQASPYPGVNTMAAQAPAPTPANTEPVFQVSPQDGTLRAALVRWATQAAWTFTLAHWAVDVDMPIVASATFSLPFTQAVQELVASTELSDQPLRACFYTNKVLRIVSHTQACDRVAATIGSG